MYWGDGVALCKKEGAEMVTITSEDENKCILDLIPSNAWIGSLYGSKYWVDGTTVVWKNWYSNTFDGHTVGYISKVHSGNWFTVSSLDARLTVVCKKKKESCPTECSASQNINSQAISANYVPPTNTRPTFTPATFAPVTRPIQPAAPLISAPRPPQVQPLQPALPTLPDTNPVALPAINRPVIQPINTDPNNVLLMPLQPTGPMPTISNLDVQCGKESMVVTVVFTQVFSGVIYAKGFHTRKECTFVQLNSGQASYTFTLVLDQCGTQFIDELGSGGQAYLENTIIIQMQEEIQEQSQDIPVTVKVGDKVLLPESGGTKVEIEDKEL
ncbi:hypothetical protein QYM36_005013 [Artemia franciscana]|uniref:C-type lectin domain-containing protein n=1 Tax=Artemia franciscana TaxID=6661 RepID=A0AA88L5L1_ARTSF|nr:hypothetical protein QYM36_005013 [Artemia franciscana]